ncbi:uncharacterized protein LOC113146935 [Cyclospora cayetanensis]|uniref:Uncharacterized protein LOC113146935 n=1 Tax=Cyclospora cayetanensis TaxID=88456 RepID=A0A6P6RUN2_9EIME|nr:uncharacterized protein LOC113146935 [Cyclospora cayetanensis]
MNRHQHPTGSAGDGAAETPQDSSSLELKAHHVTVTVPECPSSAASAFPASEPAVGRSSQDAATATTGREIPGAAARSPSFAARESVSTSSGDSSARLRGECLSAAPPSGVPVPLRSTSADSPVVSRVPHQRVVSFEHPNHSKGDSTAADAGRVIPPSRPDSRRAERAGNSAAAEKQYTTRGVQTSVPAVPPVGASCTRHPPLRAFSHLPAYDRCVVPEDSFTDKCGRGKLIGEALCAPAHTFACPYCARICMEFA